MMTNRARWILAVAITGMLLGMFFRVTHFAILNLIFIFWIAIEWLAFRVKTQIGNQLFSRVERSIDGSTAERVTLSLNQDCEVSLKVAFWPQLHGLRFLVRDLVPRGMDSTDSWPAIVDLQLESKIQWKYQVTPKVTGQLAFPGLQVTIVDKFGFFRAQRFVAHRQELSLLPFVLQPKSTAERIKRDNIHLLAGHHRFRKAGISSELLGIREYQKGDPPRSIAWKATARVGKLMTCEYESEVPIGATILADVSGYQFWGRPAQSPFDAIASAVSSITRLLIEDKDPVGVVLASAENHTRIRPGLGQRQFIRILEGLLKSAPGAATSRDYEIRDLEEYVWKSIYRIYPELVSDQLNKPRVPLLLYGPRRRYQFSIRRQASVALSWILNGKLTQDAQLAYDDEAFRQKCNEFFDRYPSVVNEAPLVADFGSGRREKEAAVSTLCSSLIASVARAHDNELYVMIGDFNIRPAVFRELVNAVRVARSRFHRVMVINVSGSAVAENIGDQTAKQAFEYIHATNASEEVRHYAAIRQLGASVAFLDNVDLLEQVIGEIQILKTGGSRGPVSSGRSGGQH